MFLAVSQSTIADWSAEDDSLDVLLRLGDSIEDLQCWRVANARATQLIQAVDEDEELAVIQRMFKAFPESGLDLAGWATRLCMLDSIVDMGEQVLAANPAIEQLQE
jgi:hypothetical protein